MLKFRVVCWFGREGIASYHTEVYRLCAGEVPQALAAFNLIVRDIKLLQLNEVAVGVQQVTVEFKETVAA